MKKNSHLTTIAISLINLSEIRPKSSLLSSWKSDVDKKMYSNFSPWQFSYFGVKSFKCGIRDTALRGGWCWLKMRWIRIRKKLPLQNIIKGPLSISPDLHCVHRVRPLYWQYFFLSLAFNFPIFLRLSVNKRSRFAYISSKHQLHSWRNSN